MITSSSPGNLVDNSIRLTFSFLLRRDAFFNGRFRLESSRR